MIRLAQPTDLDALVSIEERAFVIDRFSRRTFRYLLTKANAITLVECRQDTIVGYVMLLFHSGTSLARLYSIAVDPEYTGKGIGRSLLRAAERTVLEHDCIAIRLEVRPDNQPAIKLYESIGYRKFAVFEDYYEDHLEALRYEKTIVPTLKPALARVPYYKQTLDFTCGPAALMMAMRALDPSITLNRELELRLWRESTTIFMTSGHGGCSPYGLALAAHHHGFDVEIYVSDKATFLVDSVRSEEKKEVMKLVQQDFVKQLKELPVPLHISTADVELLHEKFENGGIPLVLISSYRIYKEKSPHWLVINGFDEKYVYAHDPYTDDKMKTALDTINMPITKKEFQRMARYGKAAQKAALIIKKKESSSTHG